MGKRVCRIGAAGFLEPVDGLPSAGLQQMCLPDPVIILPNLRIAGTEADGYVASYRRSKRS